MIWGDFINHIRTMHAECIEAFGIHPSVFSHDIELNSGAFPFPAEGDDFGEWDGAEFPSAIQEALELHPVERVLMEGQLMPIHEIKIREHDWAPLQQAILELEKDWLQKTKLFTPEKFSFVEKNLGARFVQLQRRAGRFSLKAI
jgi:hypothetical protein